jgi:Mu-like prophage major head subunit gpT
VERTALEDEQYGQIRLRIQSLAEAAARHKEQLVFELVRDGFEARCYDGQPFFSSAHPSAGGSVSTGA